ncbi:MAG: Ig-like domain-containing protein [Microthrixaceae bacterium]|nr:Ig-like domain-containing protein [Microthrixaceae bacterium]
MDVLAVASHPKSLPMTVVPFTGTSAFGGEVVCDTAKCTYTPPDPMPQSDYFYYNITDGIYTVTGYASLVSAAPVASPDTAGCLGGASLAIDVLANDYSPLGNPLTVVAQTGTATTNGGTVDCDAAGCTYFPPDPMPDTDSFTYQATDGTLTSEPAQVTITNAVCNDPTGALDDSGIVTGYAWLACTGPTSNEAVTNFTPLLPSTGASSFMMTSGTVEAAEPPNDTSGTTGAPVAPNSYRGANDVQVLRLDLDVPAGKTCLAFDFTFGSEEYPEYVGGVQRRLPRRAGRPHLGDRRQRHHRAGELRVRYRRRHGEREQHVLRPREGRHRNRYRVRRLHPAPAGTDPGHPGCPLAVPVGVRRRRPCPRFGCDHRQPAGRGGRRGRL